jgi:multiple sugar transport system ATP-binding protein
VTHDQVEAMTLADRIVVMHDGRIEQIGTPMELFLNPINTFVAGFLGSPPMNMVKAKVVAGANGPVAEFDGQSIQLAAIPALQNAVGRDVILGIRPEFVKVVAENTPNRVQVDLDLIETLGSEALIHATLSGAPFVIRAETVGQMHVLDGVSGFTIEPHLIRVFDAKTGVTFPGQVLEQ